MNQFLFEQLYPGIKTIIQALSQAALLIAAAYISITFIVISLVEIADGNFFLLWVYFLALILISLHLSVRARFPQRFIQKNPSQLNRQTKENEAYRDWLFKFFCALATSTSLSRVQV
ncbi:MAG: hypothetical protein JW991_05840 [Candidatus Pacebacteria bacterium]|nr:hypothetical protein [Candidatus Paceibacterota bacterium]